VMRDVPDSLSDDVAVYGEPLGKMLANKETASRLRVKWGWW
jgi:hypothetical protein